MSIVYIKSSKGSRTLSGAMAGLPCGSYQYDDIIGVRPSEGGVCEPTQNDLAVIFVDGTNRNLTDTYYEGDEATLLTSFATIEKPDGTTLVSLTVIGDSFGQDAATEQIEFSTKNFPSNADKSDTLVVGSTTFALAYTAATKTLVATKSGGGSFPLADGQALLRLFTYYNSTSGPDPTTRKFSIYVNDGTDDSLGSTVYVPVVPA